MNNSPIGVFDSGLGGLNIRSEIAKILPEESIIYYGDGKNCPYGEKSAEEILRISDEIVKFLIGKGAKLVVIACNSATAGAIDYLREKYAIPFVGMEPAVKPAALNSKTGVVGILATEATLRGKLFKETYQKYSDGIKIISGVGKGFVEIVEGDREDTPEALDTVHAAVEPMIAQGADHIVLGCTHYSFLGKLINEVIDGRDVSIVDPSPAVAKRVAELLARFGLAAEPGHRAEYTFYSSNGSEYTQRLKYKSNL